MPRIISKPDKAQSFADLGMNLDELQTLVQRLSTFCDGLADNEDYYEGNFPSAESTRFSSAAQLLQQAVQHVEAALTILQPEHEERSI